MEHYVFQMNDGNMSNPRALYGACLRTSEVVCTTRTSYGQKRYHVAPRVYCLLSAAPLFDALFATLHAVLRLERRERTYMIEVPVPVPVDLFQHTVSGIGERQPSGGSTAAAEDEIRSEAAIFGSKVANQHCGDRAGQIAPTPWPEAMEQEMPGSLEFVHGNLLFVAEIPSGTKPGDTLTQSVPSVRFPWISPFFIGFSLVFRWFFIGFSLVFHWFFVGSPLKHEEL